MSCNLVLYVPTNPRWNYIWLMWAVLLLAYIILGSTQNMVLQVRYFKMVLFKNHNPHVHVFIIYFRLIDYYLKVPLLSNGKNLFLSLLVTKQYFLLLFFYCFTLNCALWKWSSKRKFFFFDCKTCILFRVKCNLKCRLIQGQFGLKGLNEDVRCTLNTFC